MPRKGKIRRTRNIKHTADAMARKSGAHPNLSVDVDWKETFRSFCRLHGEGRWPIEYKGTLLFPDGWRFSTTSHQGPVWPAPTDPLELARLQRAYFTVRLKSLRWFVHQLTTTIERLMNQTKAVHVTVQVRNAIKDEQGKPIGDTTNPVDFDALTMRLREVTTERDYCEQRIKECERIINERTDRQPA